MVVLDVQLEVFLKGERLAAQLTDDGALAVVARNVLLQPGLVRERFTTDVTHGFPTFACVDGTEIIIKRKLLSYLSLSCFYIQLNMLEWTEVVCVSVCLCQLYSLNSWANFDEISHK